MSEKARGNLVFSLQVENGISFVYRGRRVGAAWNAASVLAQAKMERPISMQIVCFNSSSRSSASQCCQPAWSRHGRLQCSQQCSNGNWSRQSVAPSHFERQVLHGNLVSECGDTREGCYLSFYQVGNIGVGVRQERWLRTILLRASLAQWGEVEVGGEQGLSASLHLWCLKRTWASRFANPPLWQRGAAGRCALKRNQFVVMTLVRWLVNLSAGRARRQTIPQTRRHAAAAPARQIMLLLCLTHC